METTVQDPKTPESPQTPEPPQGDVTSSVARGTPSRLPWVLVALLAVTSLVLAGLWLSTSGDKDSEVRAAAVTFMTELTTWDASQGLDATTERLRALGTGAFLDEVDQVLGTEVQATAEALGAVSRGEVVEVIVDGNVAIVFVEQTLTVSGLVDAQEQIARLVFTQVDGQWKVEIVELLNAPGPLQQEQP